LETVQNGDTVLLPPLANTYPHGPVEFHQTTKFHVVEILSKPGLVLLILWNAGLDDPADICWTTFSADSGTASAGAWFPLPLLLAQEKTVSGPLHFALAIALYLLFEPAIPSGLPSYCVTNYLNRNQLLWWKND
jgi:hypothetical protein